MMKKKKKKRTNSSIQLLAESTKVARLYYLNKCSQSEIGKRLDLSQPEVSRLLRMADSKKLVTHLISPLFDEKLERRLLKAFDHLNYTKVIPSSFARGERLEDFLDSLGEAGAKYIEATFKSRSSIGVSCGYTVDATIKAVAQMEREGKSSLPTGCNIYPLIIMKEENISEITPVSLVSNLVRGLPSAKGKAYQLPPDQPSYQAKENAINNLMEKIEKLDNYLVGIGYIESLQDSRERQRAESREGEFNALVANLDLCEVLEKSGACGEIAHQPFDENGSIVDIDSEEFPDLRKLRKCFLCLSLTTLKNRAAVPGVNVVAIGGGYNKVKAIHAALKGKFFNALITDAVVADTILRLERKRSNRLREVNA